MSIQRFLVLVLISALTLITFYAAIQGYKTSMEKASDAFDIELESLAAILSQQHTNEIATLNDDANFSFQVWQNNTLIARSSNAPTQPMSDLNFGFSEQNFLGNRWRVFHKIIDNDGAADKKTIIVAQLLSKRTELAESVILSAVTPIIWSIPILAVIISLVIRQGLKPLTLLTAAIKAKHPDELTSIIINNNSAELIPVVNTLNSLLTKVNASVEREKQFAADAAHELRTPLSILKIAVHNLQTTSQNQTPLVDDLASGVDRMAHVVDQILLLNRTNPDQLIAQFSKVNLSKVAQYVIANLYPQLDAKQQTIELDAKDIWLLADEFALSVLLQNLISNAIKYTPAGGNILITITENTDVITCSVEDSGPGIEPNEFSKIFHRFYRIGGDRATSQASGCGLGLAIVQHIAILHKADITLGKSQRLGGLNISVNFPKHVAEVFHES